MTELKLFEYNQNEIRTFFAHGEVWFAAKDVCLALGIARGDDEIKRLNQAWVTTLDVPTPTRSAARVLVIKESALYKLAIGSDSSEADRFTNWIVGEVIPQIRRTGQYVPQPHGVLALTEHTDTSTQKSMSKRINAKYFNIGGEDAVKKYNTENCLVHTGQYPGQIKALGKRRGLKSKQRSSAKEVLCHLKPECACSMSLADNLIGEGYAEDPVRDVSQESKKIFKAMLNLGAVPRELLQD